MATQSCASVPPAPGCSVNMALLESYFPDKSVEISNFSTSFSSLLVVDITSFISSFKSELSSSLSLNYSDIISFNSIIYSNVDSIFL